MERDFVLPQFVGLIGDERGKFEFTGYVGDRFLLSKSVKFKITELGKIYGYFFSPAYIKGMALPRGWHGFPFDKTIWTRKDDIVTLIFDPKTVDAILAEDRQPLIPRVTTKDFEALESILEESEQLREANKERRRRLGLD